MTIDLLNRDSALAEWLLLSTVCLAIGIAISHVCRRNPGRAHAVLVLSMLAALLAPLLSMACGAIGWGALAPLELAASPAGSTPDHLRLLPNFRGDAISLEMIFIAVWMIAALIALLRIVVAYRRGVQIIRHSQPVTDETASAIAGEAAQRLGLNVAPQLRSSSQVSCPVIWCWGRRPTILAPASMIEGETGESLRAILGHELAHWKRRDHVTSALAELARCLLPWQPLMWWSRRQLNAFSEEACDACVIASGESPGRYARSLLDLVPQRAAPGLAAISGRHGLARRIRGILEDDRQRAGAGRRWIGSAIAITLIAITSVAMAQRRPTIVVGAEQDSSRPSFDVIAAEDSPFIVRVAPRELDLGAGPVEEPQTGTVWLVNTGDTPMTVERVKASCGCTSVRGIEDGETLAPGEIRAVEVVMTAPKTPGEAKTKKVTFLIQGQPPLELPVHLVAVDDGG